MMNQFLNRGGADEHVSSFASLIRAQSTHQGPQTYDLQYKQKNVSHQASTHNPLIPAHNAFAEQISEDASSVERRYKT